MASERRIRFLASAVAGGALALLVSTGLAETVVVEGVAAYVNSAVVTVGEVKEAIAPLAAELRGMYSGRDYDNRMREAYDDALQQLIAAKLIMEAYEADTKLNKEAVEKLVEKRVNEFIQDHFGGDRQAFIKALKDEHLPMEEWRRRLRERVIVSLMRGREVESQVAVSPRDVRLAYETNSVKYYRPERVHLRVLLIHGATNDADRAVRRKLADDTANRIRSGEDFGEQARRFSEDGKADKGGDWGWMDIGDLRKELAGPVSGTAAGTTTGVIVVENDYYLVRVEERQAAGPIPFEEARATIEKDLRRKEIRRLMDVWIERLKRDAYISIVETARP